jgi:Cof subfamily protein (haloacid dehalogenase superfamily)
MRQIKTKREVRKKERKIIVLDCDGTITRSDDYISDETYNTLKELQKDHIIIFNTGRNKPDFELMFNGRKQLGHYLIGVHGAFIISLKENKLLSYNTIDNEEIINIIKFIPDINHIYLDKICGGVKLIKEDINPSNIRKVNEIIGLSIRFNNCEDIDVLIEKLKNLNSSLNIFKMEDSHKLGIVWLIITHIESTKGEALKKLAKFKGFDLKDTLIFADSYNDISMFEVGGYRISVSNAVDEVKQRSNEIIGSNEEDSVAKWLQRLLI